MSSSKRIYRVGDHLVKASSPSVALAHVARNTIDVRVATQDDLIELRDLGVPVQNAGDDWRNPPQAKSEGVVSAVVAPVHSVSEGQPLRIMLADDPEPAPPELAPICEPVPEATVLEEDASGKPTHLLHHAV